MKVVSFTLFRQKEADIPIQARFENLFVPSPNESASFFEQPFRKEAP
jgi:hypothetical protein